MKKAKKNAPSATEPKPESVKEPEPPVLEAAVQKQEVPVEAAAEKPIVVSAPLKNILTRINSLKPSELAIINQFGLPIKDFAEWMFMMEQALGKVANLTEKGIAEELYKKTMEQRQQIQQQQPAASTGNVGGGGLGQIGTIISVMKEAGIVGGGGSSELMNKYMEALITRNMNEMVESTTFDKIMREYFVKKMSKELGEPLVGPAVAGAKP